MKILTMSLALAAMYAFAEPSLKPSAIARVGDAYEIDPVHSFALFKIKHLNLGYVWGRINSPTGTLNIDEADPSKCSVALELKAENVDTHNEKRDQHLKSPDFFNAKQHPTITFKSTAVKKTGDASFEITGTFTLLGTAKQTSVTFTRIGSGKDPWGGSRTGFEGMFTVKRSEFGMKHMLDGIGDEVQIHVAVEAVKK